MAQFAGGRPAAELVVRRRGWVTISSRTPEGTPARTAHLTILAASTAGRNSSISSGSAHAIRCSFEQRERRRESWILRVSSEQGRVRARGGPPRSRDRRL